MKIGKKHPGTGKETQTYRLVILGREKSIQS